MKNFTHTWVGEDFLLHIQLNNADPEKKFTAAIVHRFSDGRRLTEAYPVAEGQKSFRFMVSRAHPLETEMIIEYPDEITLEAYKLEDRAYYPTAAFFRG